MSSFLEIDFLITIHAKRSRRFDVETTKRRDLLACIFITKKKKQSKGEKIPEERYKTTLHVFFSLCARNFNDSFAFSQNLLVLKWFVINQDIDVMNKLLFHEKCKLLSSLIDLLYLCR